MSQYQGNQYPIVRLVNPIVRLVEPTGVNPGNVILMGQCSRDPMHPNGLTGQARAPLAQGIGRHQGFQGARGLGQWVLTNRGVGAPAAAAGDVKGGPSDPENLFYK